MFFSLVFWDPDVTHDICFLAHGSVVVPCCVYVEASVVTHSLPETGSLINASLFLMRFAGKHFDVRTNTEIAYIWCANLLSGVGWPSLFMSPLHRCPHLVVCRTVTIS